MADTPYSQKSSIFRQAALDRLSSPEQLDMKTTVTSPAGWAALLTLGAIILMAMIWGFFGSIPVKVSGNGILLRQGGVTRVVSLGSGQVSEIFLEVNDMVRRGQVVARLDNPLQLADLQNSKNKLQEFETQHQKLLEYSRKDQTFQLAALRKQARSAREAIKVLQDRVKFLTDQVKKQEELLAKGLIIPAKLEAKKVELNSARLQINSQRIKLDEVTTQINSIKSKWESRIRDSEFRMNTLRREIKLKEEKLEIDSRVVSKVSGKVVEIKVARGSVVAVGTAIISVEHSKQKMEAILYIPLADGKKIKPGMEVDVVPSSVRKEESGSLLGLVTYVSKYPVTYNAMLKVLDNEQLARVFSRDSTPYAVYVDLIPDARTASGYRWTSPKGRDVMIRSGTVCQGEIMVDTKRPVGYIMPFFRKNFGL